MVDSRSPLPNSEVVLQPGTQDQYRQLGLFEESVFGKMVKTVFICFIHGFKGDEETFFQFPEVCPTLLFAQK
jgi:hypothetical protein